MNKVYMALYTCSSTRAVHLDLVRGLDAQSFIRSLKRFFARRVNKLFISVKGKNFTRRCARKFVRDLEVGYKFNLARTPWWGGVFGRMVRCTKAYLKKILGSARLAYEELLTVLIEVEGVLNSRPLTYVYSDEIEEPLTPSHLMIRRRLLFTDPSLVTAERQFSSSIGDVTRRAKYLQLLLEHFCSRWLKEYIAELRQFH